MEELPMQIDFIFVIAVLIFSVVLHEVSHGYVAEMLGDPTARLAGRLTLNPLKHLDPLGSVILPVLLVLSGAKILVGWAKPVPYNPYNLSNQRYGEAFVAGAGPLVNIALALLFGLALRFLAPSGILPAPVVERTGAGDSFGTAFTAALCRGKDVREAMRWGTLNAAGVIQKIGPQDGLLTITELNRFLKRHLKFQPKSF